MGATEGAALGRLAYAHARAGRRADALKVLEALGSGRGRPISPYSLAAVYAGMGERERALGLLEGALEERASGQCFIKVDPVFDNLRPEPRFVRRAGLQP